MSFPTEAKLILSVQNSRTTFPIMNGQTTCSCVLIQRVDLQKDGFTFMDVTAGLTLLETQ